MFGSKKSEPQATAPTGYEGYQPRYEYLAVAYLGIGAFNKEVNVLAGLGWELINGCMAGTAHYGYLRREIRYTASTQA